MAAAPQVSKNISPPLIPSATAGPQPRSVDQLQATACQQPVHTNKQSPIHEMQAAHKTTHTPVHGKISLWKRSLVPKSARMEPKKDTFECQLCGLTAPYSYYGHKPPNAYSVTLLEDCYVMNDPFTPDKDTFLILGAQCSLCHKRVCAGPDCSLFYSKRFCLPCVSAHISEFPLEIEEDLKKKAHSKSSKKGDSKNPGKS